jgi:hypothetical protein
MSKQPLNEELSKLNIGRLEFKNEKQKKAFKRELEKRLKVLKKEERQLAELKKKNEELHTEEDEKSSEEYAQAAVESLKKIE